MSITPQDFVSKWTRAEARECQSVQEHFIDLCGWLGMKHLWDRTPLAHALPLKWVRRTSAPYTTPTAGPTTTVNGTWKIVSSPNVGSGTYGNQLNAVAAVSANDVWAVG